MPPRDLYELIHPKNFQKSIVSSTFWEKLYGKACPHCYKFNSLHLGESSTLS